MESKSETSISPIFSNPINSDARVRIQIKNAKKEVWDELKYTAYRKGISFAEMIEEYQNAYRLMHPEFEDKDGILVRYIVTTEKGKSQTKIRSPDLDLMISLIKKIKLGVPTPSFDRPDTKICHSAKSLHGAAYNQLMKFIVNKTIPDDQRKEAEDLIESLWRQAYEQ